MLLRFTTICTLLASIALCVVANYQTGSNYGTTSEEPITVLDNLVPFEKFSEGDVTEPLLYGQYTITENVSPYIPLNILGINTDPYINSYGQTPANAYETPAPMSTSFNVYKAASNPAPVQYKPAIPIPAHTEPVSLSTPVNYGVDSTYAPVVQPQLTSSYSLSPSYLPVASHSPPIASYGQSPAIYPSSSSYALPLASYSSAPIAHSPKPDIIYGINYEKTFVPVTNYHSPSPVSYHPTPEPIHPYIPPITYPAKTITYGKVEKPYASKTEEEKPPTNLPKKEEGTTTKKPPTTVTVNNDPPSVKPPTEPKDTVTPSPVNKPTSTIKAAPKNEKLTGYRYINRRTLPVNTRSPPMPNFYNQQPAIRSTQKTAYAYRSTSPYLAQTSPLARSVNRTLGEQMRRSPVAPTNFRSIPVAKNSRGANYYGASSPIYNSPKHHYSAGYQPSGPIYNSPKHHYSTGYQSSGSIYNENNVAEVVLRGYSQNKDENANKAIIRIFEEAPYALYFDMRICGLKKNHIYSIYIHEYGQLTAGCESCGGLYGAKETYFNPMLGVRSNPKGFCGSFKYTGDPVNIQHFASNLIMGDIVGRSMVIHEINPNTKVLPEALENHMLNSFSILLNPISSPLVTSRRVACGVIGRANPYTFLTPIHSECDIEVPTIIPLKEERLSYDKKREVKEEAETTSKKETSSSN